MGETNTDKHRLTREKLVEFVYNKFNNEKDDITKLTVDLLNEILNELNKYVYDSDTRFYSLGRRQYLEHELVRYLKNGNLTNAWKNFCEYIRADFMLTESNFINEFEFKLFGKEDGDYKKDGIICEEEKEIIVFMLNEIKFEILNTGFSLDNFEDNNKIDNTKPSKRDNKKQDNTDFTLAIKQYYEDEKQGKHRKLDNGSIALNKDIFTTIEDEELGKITIMQDGYIIGKKVKIEECNYDYKIPIEFSGDYGFEIYAFNEEKDRIKENFQANQDKYIRNIKKIVLSQKKIVKHIIKYVIEFYEKIESSKWTNINISVGVNIDTKDRVMLNVGFSFEEYDGDKFIDDEDGYIDVIFDCTTNNIEKGDYGWY